MLSFSVGLAEREGFGFVGRGEFYLSRGHESGVEFAVGHSEVNTFGACHVLCTGVVEAEGQLFFEIPQGGSIYRVDAHTGNADVHEAGIEKIAAFEVFAVERALAGVLGREVKTVVGPHHFIR